MTHFPFGEAAGIIIGPDRNLWCTGGSSTGLGRVTPQGVATAIVTQPPIVTPSAITLGPDGNVWFAAPTDNVFNDTVGYVGKITPAGVATPYALPTAHAYPLDIVAGPDGNLWFTEMNANKIGRITPAASSRSSTSRRPTASPPPSASGRMETSGSRSRKRERWDVSSTGPASGKVTLTVPAAASSAGANGTFFHSDLWLLNRSFTATTVVTLTFRCATGLACGDPVQPVVLARRQSTMLTDVIGRTFGAPGSSGAIEISWPTTSGPVSAYLAGHDAASARPRLRRARARSRALEPEDARGLRRPRVGG